MRETGLTFKDIFQYHQEENVEELAKRAPLHRIVLNMIIRHMPDPLTAQKLRIPVIWKGPPDSEIGRSMTEVDEDGPVAFVVTKIIIDPQAGEFAVGRIFSGTIRKGQEAWILGMPKPERVQTVNMLVGAERVRVDEITAGNVAALQGLKTGISGSTVADDPDMIPFERIVHYSEPVVTVAIEAKHTRDLAKLVDALRIIAKADPSIQVDVDQETGEHLMSGMGELHLDITQYRIIHEHKVEIDASPPIVVYRESVKAAAGPFEGKSPNKHNRFYFEVEPLEEAVVQAILDGKVPTNQRVKSTREFIDHLRELGMNKTESRKIIWIQDNNLLVDMTKGIQYLHETIELVREAFIEAATKGPLAGERCMGVKVRLVDAKLHEDSIHRGPAQVIPASRSAMYGAMVIAGRILLEPKQNVVLSLSQEVMGPAIAELQSRRGVIENIEQEGDDVTITAKVPVAEMFGFATAIRSATAGRVIWSYENAGFEQLPADLQEEVVAEIRTRKGLKPQPYDANYYAA
jgi:elongation factor 2